MPEIDSQRALSKIVSADLVLAASTIAGFKFTKPEFGSAGSISGVRSKSLTFSKRHDSLTIFASDGRYGHLGKDGAWIGSDKEPITECRRVLPAGVPAKEIADITVVAEMGRVAERVSEKEIRIQEPTLLRKLARARRAVEGVPVWNSFAMVGLAEQRNSWLA